MSFINGLSDINNDIKLYKYEGKDLKPNINYKVEPIDAKSDKIRISFLDVETTGLDKGEDSIIEIAIKCVELTKEDGNNLVVVDSYESFQDPGRPIPEEATEINGISDTMVKDQSIDWNKVKEIFIPVLFVIGTLNFSIEFTLPRTFSFKTRSIVFPASSLEGLLYFL